MGSAIIPVRPASVPMGPATIPMGPVTVPMGLVGVPMGPAIIPVGPVIIPAAPAVVPMGPASLSTTPPSVLMGCAGVPMSQQGCATLLHSLLQDASVRLWVLLINTNFWRGCGVCGELQMGGARAGRLRAEARTWAHAFFIGCTQVIFISFYFLPPPLTVKVPVDKELVPGR